jgi:hypothetical protein
MDRKRKLQVRKRFYSAYLKYFLNDNFLLPTLPTASAYQSHVAQMAGAVQELAVQEMKAQLFFHSFANNTRKIFGSV